MKRRSLPWYRKGFLLLARVLAALFLFLSTVAQAQNLGWAKAIQRGDAIAVDAFRNIFMVGGFTESKTFGAGEANATTLVSAGNDDIFVAKYDSNGALVWAKRAGGSGIDFARGVAVDDSGNSYVIGNFGASQSGTHSATFGAGGANQTTLKSVGEYDIFVAKYDPNGQLIWAKRAGGTGWENGISIVVDGFGNSYVTGNFSAPSATFGAGEPNQTTLTSAGSNDVFVAKYNTNGTLAWAKRAGGTVEDFGRSIAVDGSGNSYVTGRFSEVATFGLTEANQTVLTSAGDSDMFVAKYASNGLLIWAKRAGGAGFDGSSDIALDGFGNSYVTGTLFTAATFGPGEPNETTLMSPGGETFYLAKYDSSGMLLWAKEAVGSDASHNAGANAIAVDSSGYSYVIGSFSGSVTFGLGEAYETTLTSIPPDESDVFVAKYDPNGAFQWPTRAGGSGFDLETLSQSIVRGIAMSAVLSQRRQSLARARSTRPHSYPDLLFWRSSKRGFPSLIARRNRCNSP